MKYAIRYAYEVRSRTAPYLYMAIKYAYVLIMHATFKVRLTPIMFKMLQQNRKKKWEKMESWQQRFAMQGVIYERAWSSE